MSGGTDSRRLGQNDPALAPLGKAVDASPAVTPEAVEDGYPGSMKHRFRGTSSNVGVPWVPALASLGRDDIVGN